MFYFPLTKHRVNFGLANLGSDHKFFQSPLLCLVQSHVKWIRSQVLWPIFFSSLSWWWHFKVSLDWLLICAWPVINWYGTHLVWNRNLHLQPLSPSSKNPWDWIGSRGVWLARSSWQHYSLFQRIGRGWDYFPLHNSVHFLDEQPQMANPIWLYDSGYKWRNVFFLNKDWSV